MSVARSASLLIVLFAMGFRPAAVLGDPAAPAPSVAPTAPASAGKPAEVSTVGATPGDLTTAERAARAAREARAARSAQPGRALLPPGLRPSSEPYETRIPAVGPRNRTKPIQSAEEVTAREKERAQ